MEDLCGHFSVVSGRTQLDYVTRRFNPQKHSGLGHRFTRSQFRMKPEENIAAKRRKLEIRSSKSETRTECSNKAMFETPARFDHFPPSVIRNCFGFRYSIFGFSSQSLFGISSFDIRVFLPLVALAFSFLQVPSVAKAETALTSPGIDTNISVEGIDCRASKKEKKQPAQDNDNSPDSTTDLNDDDGGLDEVSAGTSARNDQDTPHFSVTDPAAVTLRALSFLRLRQPASGGLPYNSCLHEHTRERAPPSAVASAEEDPPA